MTRIKHDDTLTGSRRKAQNQPNRRSRRCKHELFNVALLSGTTHYLQVRETVRWFIRHGLALTVTCSDCGATLSLGNAKGRRLVAFALDEPTAEMLDEDVITEPWTCPVDSNECAIRRRCTNKCGALDSPPSVISAQTRHDVAAAAARHAELEIIVGTEPEAGVEVEIGTSHEINADCPGLGCTEDGAAHDPDEEDDRVPREPGCKCHWEIGDSPCPVHPDPDDESTPAAPQTCTPDSCAPSCPARVRSDDAAPVDETGGEA